MKTLFALLFSFFLFSCFTFSQEDTSLLSLLEEKPATEYVTAAFKSPRVINSHSMEMLHAGVLDFRILHRFARLDQGLYDMFGLDDATMRMGFDYGITENLTIGIGRSTRNKELDGFVKFRFLRQMKGERNTPVSLVWVSGATINGLRTPFPGVEEKTADRLAYYHQLIAGRKFSEKFSLQLAPFLVYRNFTMGELDPNALYGVELGARFKITRRIALVLDYSAALNRFPGIIERNPLSLGFDIETGGHVFQLHFSNAIGTNERSFISDPNGSWLDGEVQFGFNLSRVFQLKKAK